MRTKANRQRRGIPKPPKPPTAPQLHPARHAHTKGMLRPRAADIERKAAREQDMSAYKTPDDILGPMLMERILAQHPEIDKESYQAFWVRNFQLEPNEDDRAAVEHITKLLRDMEGESS